MKYKIINEDYRNKGLLESVLENRNITIEDVESLLNANEKEYKDPFQIVGMDRAVKFFKNKINENIKIALLVDEDTDGFTSSSLLYRWLIEDVGINENNIELFFHIKRKQHGLDSLVFNDMLKSNADLFILADSSTNDIEQHKKLISQNKDIIILDHHLCDRIDDVLDEVYLVNNQLEGSESKNLSGVGVVGKFIEACGYSIDKYMDLIAIGLVADSMNMLDLENRAIVNYGLSHLNNDMIKEFFKDIKNPTITDISWGIANYINSVIRFGKEDERRLCFDVLTCKKGILPYKKRNGEVVNQTLAESFVRISNNVKNRQNKAIKKEVEILERDIYKNGLDKDKCIIINNNTIDHAIRGVVAQRLCSKFKKPIMLLSPYKGELAGSVRSPFDGFKEMVENSNKVTFAQGHSGAFGIGIKEENIDKLRTYLNEQLKDLDTNETVIDVDYIFNFGEFNLNDIKPIADLSPLYCRDIKEPLFIVKNLIIESKDIEHKKNKKCYTTSFKKKGLFFEKNFSSQNIFEQMTMKDQLKFGRSHLLNLTLLVKFKKNERGFYYIEIIDFNVCKSNKIIF